MVNIDLLLVILLFPAVHLIGVEFICPLFRDGQNIVSCNINRTAVQDAKCDSVQDYMSLEKTTSTRWNPLVINSTKSFSPTDCKPVREPVPDGCWCNGSNGDIFEYKCAFVANRSKDIDALLECQICHSPKNYLETKIHNCNPMRFDSNSQGSLSVGLIVGITIAVVVGFF